jgi:hypothetical protein
MWQYIIPAIASIIVAIVEYFAAKDRKAVKRHAEIRAEESRLSMKMHDASLQLCIVTANALTGGHNNGNVERARIAAREAQDEYNDFMQRIAAQEITR